MSPDTTTKKAPSNLQLRVLTGIVGIASIVGAVVVSPYGYLVVFAGISLLCQWEFYGLLRRAGYAPERPLGMVLGLGLNIAGWLAAQGIDQMALLLAMVMPITLTYLAKLYRNETTPFVNIALTFFGVLYTAVPFALLHPAVFVAGQYSWQIPLGILLLLWASDTGAYFAGRSLGRRKLFERVSPKKTWEGFAGGFTASAAVSAVLANQFTDLAGPVWVWVMVIIVVLGTFGDLTESLFKRSLDLKDSGSILPGHGGFLDRFDGLLIALPVVAALLLLWHP